MTTSTAHGNLVCFVTARCDRLFAWPVHLAWTQQEIQKSDAPLALSLNMSIAF